MYIPSLTQRTMASCHHGMIRLLHSPITRLLETRFIHVALLLELLCYTSLFRRFLCTGSICFRPIRLYQVSLVIVDALPARALILHCVRNMIRQSLVRIRTLIQNFQHCKTSSKAGLWHKINMGCKLRILLARLI